MSLPNNLSSQNSSKTTFIYGLWDPRNYQLRYIGKSDNPQLRLKQHIFTAINNGKSYRDNWIRSLLTEDLEPSVEVLEEVDTFHWKLAEKAWIADCEKFGLKLVNGTDGGDGPFSFTLEVRKKFSLLRKGMKFSDSHKESMKRAWIRRKEQYGNNGFTDDGLNRIRIKQEKWRNENKEAFDKMNESKRGQTRSEETKKKLREANLGKKISDEIREKISKGVKGKTTPPMKGKKWSPEMIEVFRERSRGKPQSEETRRKRSETFRAKRIGVGRKLSEEHKKKIGDSSRGRYHTEETKRKISEANKNREKSSETKEKISQANKGRYISEENKQRLREMGRNMSEETRQKLREKSIGNKYALGHKHTEETRRKISESLRKRNA